MQRCQRGELCDPSHRSNTPTARQHLSARMTSWQDPQNTAALCSEPQLPSEISTWRDTGGIDTAVSQNDDYFAHTLSKIVCFLAGIE